MSSLLFATPAELTTWLSGLASSHRVLAPCQEGPSVVYRPQTAKQISASGVNALLRRSTASPKQAILPIVLPIILILIVGRTFFSSYQSYIMMFVIILSGVYSYTLHKKGML